MLWGTNPFLIFVNSTFVKLRRSGTQVLLRGIPVVFHIPRVAFWFASIPSTPSTAPGPVANRPLPTRPVVWKTNEFQTRVTRYPALAL